MIYYTARAAAPLAGAFAGRPLSHRTVLRFAEANNSPVAFHADSRGLHGRKSPHDQTIPILAITFVGAKRTAVLAPFNRLGRGHFVHSPLNIASVDVRSYFHSQSRDLSSAKLRNPFNNWRRNGSRLNWRQLMNFLAKASIPGSLTTRPNSLYFFVFFLLSWRTYVSCQVAHYVLAQLMHRLYWSQIS